MASSYSSAKLAPPVSGASVDAFEFRADNQLWFIIQVHPCHVTLPGVDSMPIPRKSYTIYRRYEDVVDFADHLELEFPQNNVLSFFRHKNPVLPLNRPRRVSMVQANADYNYFKHELDQYLQKLFTLSETVGQCRLVSEFFGIWLTDLQFHLSQENKDPLALSSLVTRRPSCDSSMVAEPVEVLPSPVESSVSSPPWSPISISSFSSSPSSVSSPSLPPSPTNGKNAMFVWDNTPPSLFDGYFIRRRNIPSPPGSSYHSDSEHDGDASCDESDVDPDVDGNTSVGSLVDMFPIPSFAVRKVSSMQELSAHPQRCECSCESTPFPLFAEGTSQFESALSRSLPSSPSFPVGYNAQPRRPSSLNPQARPRSSTQTSVLPLSIAPKTSSPMNSKPIYVSTSPLSPKMRTSRKDSTNSIFSHSIRHGSISSLSSSVPSLSQKQPISILRKGFSAHRYSSSSSSLSLSSSLSSSLSRVGPSSPMTPPTSPAPGAKFLALHPSGFAATFKVVVCPETIIALQVLEESADFVLTVPDLRLRVMNKFQKVDMPIPGHFELIWTAWDDSRVVLKNDEELHKVLMASPNHKLTLRCIF
ncbi:hypothetical protein BGX23_010197 [Mortierella sp. AD031]|nr:hypothetical protein BGX23_010197 [Mortierella sp. AD031]